MNEFDWLLLAYQLDGQGGGYNLSKEQICLPQTEGVRWIHLHADYPETKQWLTEKSNLDPIVVDALTAEETRPRMFEVNDGAVIILRGVNLNNHADPEDMVSVRMFINQHQIISVRKRRIRAIVSIEEHIQKGKGPRTTGEFLETLVDRLCFYIEPAITNINEQIDEIEENIITYTDKNLRKMILDIRRQSIIFKRYLSPQRDVLSHLKIVELSWLSSQHKRLLHECYDRVTRFVEDLDAARERAQVMDEEIKHALTDQLNRNMYILSVFAAIFLPLSFITGLFGVNLSGIPGAQNNASFGLFSITLIFISLLLILIFRRLKWI